MCTMCIPLHAAVGEPPWLGWDETTTPLLKAIFFSEKEMLICIWQISLVLNVLLISDM